MKKLIGSRAFYAYIFSIMLPMLLQNIITNFVSLLDNVMVGRIGTEQMSGVAIVNQLMFVFNLCIFGGLAGAGIFTAQFYGKGEPEGIRSTFRSKIYIAACSLLAFMAVFIAMGDSLISTFLHEGSQDLDLGATLGYAHAYLQVMLWGLLPFAWTQVYAGTLRETGETRIPMIASITAVFVNLVFNYILIFGKLGAPRLGVVGAAAATVLSRFVEFAIVAIYTHTHTRRYEFVTGLYSTMKVPRELALKILAMGAPLLLNELLWSSGMTMLNQCYSMRGLEVVSAVNISTTITNLFFCAFIACGNTISIIIGQMLGAGKLEEAVDSDFKLIAFSFALSIVLGLIMIPVAFTVPMVYNTSGYIRNLAAKLILVFAAAMPLFSITNSCYFTLRCGGKTIITFIFDSLFVWVINVPLAFVLSRYTGVPIVPMYALIQATELFKCVLGLVLIKKRTWVNNLVG